jgi:hypothetical protein
MSLNSLQEVPAIKHVNIKIRILTILQMHHTYLGRSALSTLSRKQFRRKQLLKNYFPADLADSWKEF